MAQSRATLPVPLVKAARRFERWRAERTTRRRTPEELWALATRLGAEYGVSPTARALRVHAHTLKQRVEAARPAERETPASAPTFVEIQTMPDAPGGQGGCRVVFESVAGEKMRVELLGAHAADLSTLTRLFLGPRT